MPNFIAKPNKAFWSDPIERCTARRVHEIVRDMLMTRAGDYIDESLADERGRNIATALSIFLMSDEVK